MPQSLLKQASQTRKYGSLEQLLYLHEVEAGRLRILQASGVFPTEDLQERQKSLTNLVLHIADRKRAVKLAAYQHTVKVANNIRCLD